MMAHSPDAGGASVLPDAHSLAEAQLQLALAAGGAGTWQWERTSGRVHFDEALEHIYGFERGRFDGTVEHWFATLHPDDRDRVMVLLEASMESGGATEVEHRIVRADGTVRWLHGRGAAVRDGGGNVVGMHGVAMDITERHEIEAERARLLASERAAREQMEFLAEAGAVLANSLDLGTTLQRLADLAVPRLGDLCVVELLEQGRLRQQAVAHQDPATRAAVRQMRIEHRPSEVHGSLRVVRTGVSELIPQVTDEVLRVTANDGAHLEMLRSLGLTSAIVVPLSARGQVIGAVQLLRTTGPRYTQDDLRLGEELARRAALAVDNARLYEEQRTAATLLQRALLPSGLPRIDGCDLAARYEPAAVGSPVGGDFYDVFEHHSGSWTILIGDVCGKGTAAASLTALARHSIRATALHDPDPVRLLHDLNAVLLQDEASDRFCSAVCARLECRDGEALLEVAVAGHPPPVLVRAGGAVEQLSPAGSLIGVFDDLEIEVQRVRLSPGDTLLAYTDGVTEARRGRALFGVDGLLTALRVAPAASAESLVERVVAAVREFEDGPGLRDDVALLAVRAIP